MAFGSDLWARFGEECKMCFPVFEHFPAWENLLILENRVLFRVHVNFPERENG